MSEKRSRPELASGATNRIKNPGTVSTPDSIGTVPVLAIPSPVDVSSLNVVERAWVGGLLSCSAADARDATGALFRGALSDQRLAVVARAVWKVAAAGERPDWSAVGAAASGMVRPTDHGRFMALLVDLAGVDSAPRGAGEVTALWPLLVDQAARRAALHVLERVRHGVDEQTDGHVLAAGLREAAVDLAAVADRLSGEGSGS